MGLADQIVVMNHGRIEQCGAAQDVFNRPRTEFVARFLGGHNVLGSGADAFTVRADHLHVQAATTAPADKPGVACTVRAAEYQGTHLRVTLAPLDGTPELVALMPEGIYDAAQTGPGAQVRASWLPGDAHAFAA